MSERVLLIGLDSADADLIERWIAAGDLPNLAALKREGVWSRLRTTAEVMHVSAWPTIYTGVTPGRHGMYHAYQMRAGDQRIHRASPSWCAQPPFWKHLDQAGRRCIIFDAFMDSPLEAFRGLQVLDYGTWTWFGEPGSTPPRLLRDIKAMFGPYPGPEHMDVTSVPGDLAGFRDGLIAGAARKAEVTRWLMREQAWDFLFVTFGEPHGAGHYLWHVHDDRYPAHPGSDDSRLAGAVHDVYAAIDRSIGEILAATDDRTTVLVVSGDGMGPNYSGCHHMAPLLSRMDLLRSAEGGNHKGGLIKRLRGAIPMSWRQSVTRCMPKASQHRLATSWMNQGTDWSRTQAFLIPNSNEAYIRLNIAGREPAGILPSAEAEPLLRSLQQEFGQLSNPDNGLQATERATVVDDVFPGAERRHLPDLVVSWRDAARVLDRLASPSHGIIESRPAYRVSPFYTGNHRPVAFVAGRGPGVRRGGLPAGAHILDLPCTILALLGVEAPRWFEGRVWDALLPLLVAAG